MDEATTRRFFDTCERLQRLRDADVSDLREFALQHTEFTEKDVRRLVENTLRASIAFDNEEVGLRTKQRKIILGTPARRRFQAVQEAGIRVRDWLDDNL